MNSGVVEPEKLLEDFLGSSPILMGVFSTV